MKGHPITVSAQAALADVLLKREKYNEALPHAEQASEGSERALGHSHPNTIATVDTLMRINVNLGRLPQLLLLLSELIEMEGGSGPISDKWIRDLTELFERAGLSFEALLQSIVSDSP